MRKRALIIVGWLLISPLFSTVDAGKIPSSQQSERVIKRVKPLLERRLSQKGLSYGLPIFIRIFKHSGELELWMEYQHRYKLFKTYPICTYGWGGLGPKLRRNDSQAPEGFYFVTPRQLNPYSSYHLSFNLGYPNRYDREHGRTGGALMIHGNCVSLGCFAMTDRLIEEIYALADGAFRGGQPFFRVHIFPFRMTPANMEKRKNSRWIEFWRNLKEGYDFFQRENRPPNVTVKTNRYVFE